MTAPGASSDLVVRDAERRADSLARLQLLEGLPPEALQRIARLAAYVAGGPGTTISAGVHLLDDRHQHRVAGVGATLERSDVEDSLCVRALRLDEAVYTTDAAADPRLSDTPWTTGDEPLRLYIGIPLRLRDGDAVGTLCLFDTRPHELSELQRSLLEDLALEASAHLELVVLTRDLGHDATHDPLTGVANRVLLSQHLTQALSRRPRLDGGPALLLIDLDGFKGVNDRYGHAIGDQVLLSTAQRLSATLRPEDLLARIGGDEFAVLVDTVAGDDELAAIVARLRACAVAPHDTLAGPVPCGFSIGVARAGAGDLSYELLGRADADLYADKAGLLR